MKPQSAYYAGRIAMLKSDPFQPDAAYLMPSECPGCGHRLRYGWNEQGKVSPGRCEFCFPARCPQCSTGPLERTQDGRGDFVDWCSRCQQGIKKGSAVTPKVVESDTLKGAGR